MKAEGDQWARNQEPGRENRHTESLGKERKTQTTQVKRGSAMFWKKGRKEACVVGENWGKERTVGNKVREVSWVSSADGRAPCWFVDLEDQGFYFEWDEKLLEVWKRKTIWLERVILITEFRIDCRGDKSSSEATAIIQEEMLAVWTRMVATRLVRNSWILDTF